MIDKRLIPLVEEALGFKLYPMVIQYLTTDNIIGISWGRKTGKTIAYTIALALKKDKEVSLSNLKRGMHADIRCESDYGKWYAKEFMRIRKLLQEKGLEVIKVIP